MNLQESAPRFTMDEARQLAHQYYGLTLDAKPLDSYIDQNIRLFDDQGEGYVLKIANAAVSAPDLDLENRMLSHLREKDATMPIPRLVSTQSDEEMVRIPGRGDLQHLMRLYTWQEGSFWADTVDQEEGCSHFMAQLGGFLGRLNSHLQDFHHPAAHRPMDWDLKQAAKIRQLLHHVQSHEERTILTWFFDYFDMEIAPALPGLPMQVVHNDANDYNVLSDGKQVTGLIDFGDAVYTYRVCEVAIAAAYAMTYQKDPVRAAAQTFSGYHKVNPLTEAEIQVAYGLCCMRLVSSAVLSARSLAQRPENTYIAISQKPVRKTLHRLIGVHPEQAVDQIREACGLEPLFQPKSKQQLLERRRTHLNPTLSLSYAEPLKIIRGFRQYLYAEDGRRYLDCVNNVCHVGHAHPHVVRAGARQMQMLNTNTRYLHDNLVDYAERLLATFPEELSVVTFVCSGSEANDLAQRMARTHTGRNNMVILGAAYHGNTTVNIDVSPYKYDRKGGPGKPKHVFEAQMPDPFRGPHQGHDEAVGKAYAEYVRHALADAETHGGAAAFIAESALGCGGQVILPHGYLKAAYAHAREAGAVCIADEVQVGFGRAGTHMWMFETQGVVPDIVTLGKPIGNGHPLAAVVTTREIADSFNTGMEYFNTFGGNPVSCAVGMAVLDVIEREQLQANALEVGNHLQRGLAALAHKYPLIGEVRGQGLFIGVELVRNTALEPATAEAKEVVNRMKQRSILLSTDGPMDNVLKIKPPIVFARENADHLVLQLDEVFAELQAHN